MQIENTPLILVGKMWPGLVEWARTSMLTFETPLINREDIDIPRCVANGDEAIEILRQSHAQWLQNRSQADARHA